jgi:hypothetical protein
MRLSLLCISTIVLVSLIGISALSGNRSTTQQNAPLQIANRTRAFAVIKAERGSNEFSITLKNNSAKTITAFSISPSKGFTITEEFILAEISDVGIGPDALFSKTYPTLASIQPQSIEIKALIFDDGTAEGDTRAVRQMEDSRLGQQIQIRRAVKELENFLAKGSGDVSEFKRNLSTALNSSDYDTLNILTELKPSRAITQQPLSADLREGLDNGRQSVLRRLSEAETNGSYESFLALKKNYERILGRCSK